MKITIEVDTWSQAHHLGIVLADAAWQFRKNAETDTYGISDALIRHAEFFERTAKAVTKQADPLNQKLWDDREKQLDAKT